MTNKFDALPARHGHFLLESGLHSDVWFDLDTLFVDPARIEPNIAALADLIRQSDVTAVCGPLLGGAFVAQALATRLNLRFFYTERLTSSATSELYQTQYRLPRELRKQAAGERMAIVDDVISAGSSVRATVAEVQDCGASVAVVGALLLLGSLATAHFERVGISLVAPEARAFTAWEPAHCPLCQAGQALINPCDGD